MLRKKTGNLQRSLKTCMWKELFYFKNKLISPNVEMTEHKTSVDIFK